MPSGLTWVPDYTGSATEADLRASQLLIALENERRAAQDPPLSPLTVNKTNVLALMSQYQTSWWQSYIDQADQENFDDEFRARYKISSEAQRQAALNDLEPLP